MQEPTTKLDPEPTAARLTAEVRRLALGVLRRYLDRESPDSCNFTQADFALRVLAALGCEEPPAWVFGDEEETRAALKAHIAAHEESAE